MVQILLIGIGAGAASALLFVSTASGSILSIPLFCLAPLPILIAALGWSHWAALVAVPVASLGLTIVFGMGLLPAFLLTIGLPGWWLGYLAMLARTEKSAPHAIEWYPPGRLLVWAALFGAGVVVLSILNFGTDEETYRAGFRRAIERMIRIQPSPSRAADAEQLINMLVLVLPLLGATLTTTTNVLNLWLAGRIVRISGRLRRPWWDLRTVSIPASVPLVLAAAAGASFLGNILGTVASFLAASLVTAYAMVGFAVLHVATRDLAVRIFLLGVAYVVVILFSWMIWPLLLMALLGLLDSAIDIRGWFARRRGPPAYPT